MMLPGSFFTRELVEDLKRKRSLVFKIALPILLVLVFTVDAIPEAVRAGGLPLIIAFFGVLGSAIGLVRMKEGGMLERLVALPISLRRLTTEYLMANLLLDFLQLLIPLAIIVGVSAVYLGALPVVLVFFAASILAANSLGVIVASLTSSSGEVHLYSIIVIFVVAGMSGLFMGSPPESLGWLAGLWPFGQLSDAIQFAWGGPSPALGLAIPFTIVLFVISVSLSPRMARGVR